MNILHIINGWPTGGIAEQTYLIGKYLDKQEFTQYSIGYCHFDGAFYKKFQDIGLECIHSDEQYSNLYDILVDKKIDIVHKQTGGGDCPNYIHLLKEMGIPLIETLHCPRKTAIPNEYADTIIYTTEYTKLQDPSNNKLRSIQYSLDLKEPFYQQRVHKSIDPVVVGRLSRITPDKMCHVILSVARQFYYNGLKNFKFKLAGMIPKDYPLHVSYGQKFLEECEDLPNVEYVGFVEDKYDFWKTLDICLNPVWETSFDIVFLEAMACGVPIITWNNSAAPYVVKDAGIVCEESLPSLCESVYKLGINPRERTILGENGINLINTIYSLDMFVEEYTKLYREVKERKV